MTLGKKSHIHITQPEAFKVTVAGFRYATPILLPLIAATA